MRESLGCRWLQGLFCHWHEQKKYKGGVVRREHAALCSIYG